MSSKHCKVSGLRKQFNPKVNAECSIPRSVKLSRQVAELRCFRDTGWTLTNVGNVLNAAQMCSLQSFAHTVKIAVSYLQIQRRHSHSLLYFRQFGQAGLWSAPQEI